VQHTKLLWITRCIRTLKNIIFHFLFKKSGSRSSKNLIDCSVPQDQPEDSYTSVWDRQTNREDSTTSLEGGGRCDCDGRYAELFWGDGREGRTGYMAGLWKHVLGQWTTTAGLVQARSSTTSALRRGAATDWRQTRAPRQQHRRLRLRRHRNSCATGQSVHDRLFYSMTIITAVWGKPAHSLPSAV